MKYKFQVENNHFDVEITNTATFFSETTLRIDNKDFNVSIADYDEKEIKSFRVNERLYRVELQKDNEGYPTGIYVNGEFYPAALLKIDKYFYFKEKPLKSSKSGIVKSFIPGSVKKIFYRVNDRVNEGDIVLILEAMKMENEIRAPRAGMIKTIEVKEEDNVLANHLLFEIG